MMISDFYENFRRAVVALTGFILAGTCLVLASATCAQGRTSQVSVAEVQVRVPQIIDEVIRESSGVTAEGVKYYTFVPPSSRDVEEIRGFGPPAIKILEHYVWSRPDSREAFMALRLLGLVGGPQSVESLRAIAQKHKNPGFRTGALRGLIQSDPPSDRALMTIRRAAEQDHDKSVRKVARELLDSYGPKSR